jgi:hypothetical protein
MKRALASVATVMLLASLVASPAASASPGSGSASMTISLSVKAKVDYTVVDHDHIDVRSNAPWRIALVTEAGPSTVAGPATGNQAVRVALPEGTTDYFVTLEH